MRPEPNMRIEKYRHCPPGYESPVGRNWGAFAYTYRGNKLRIISSGTDMEHGWEHVSVSLLNRCPTWDEMCKVKELFWDDDETVFQFHPPRDRNINFCETCLHLWKRIGSDIELPPDILIGPKGGE